MVDRITARMHVEISWERAKGELRSMVSAAGYYRLGPLSELDAAEANWQDLRTAVEEFITTVEDGGLIE